MSSTTEGHVYHTAGIYLRRPGRADKLLSHYVKYSRPQCNSPEEFRRSAARALHNELKAARRTVTTNALMVRHC